MRCHMILRVLPIILLLGSAAAADDPVGRGDAMPDLVLAAPQDPALKAYLGLKGAGAFELQDIDARLVIVEIFSMYCPHCQREAPVVNRLYRLLHENERWRDTVKLIGIGVGNSPYEVNFFRETYEIPFPLFADGDFVIHKALKKPRTPYFLVLRREADGKMEIVDTRLGGFGDPAGFLRSILKKSGLGD